MLGGNFVVSDTSLARDSSRYVLDKLHPPTGHHINMLRRLVKYADLQILIHKNSMKRRKQAKESTAW